MAQGKPFFRPVVVAVGLFLIVAVGGAAWWLLSPSPPADGGRVVQPIPAPPDPRLSYAGPFTNIHPSTAYAGSERCRDCHRQIADSYAQHPMGRSLLPIAAVADSQVYAGHNNPFAAFDSVFFIEREGKRLYHRRKMLDQHGKTVFQSEQQVHYALGSGNHGYSYLTNRDGFLFQTFISWYSQKNIWDISPGYSEHLLSGRLVSAECFFCHSNRALHRHGTINGFEEPIFHGHAIGCERCHGPGEQHVKQRGRFRPAPWDPSVDIDPTIVNPGKLPVELREAVCQQCHLEGAIRVLPRGRDLYDFRPGLPLEPFWSIFVRDAGRSQKAVNHVEQMYLSGCFQRSKGKNKLGCISCHDPHYHVPASEREEYFRKRCLNCHAEPGQTKGKGTAPGCSLPLAERLAKRNSCNDCHMPRYATSDIAHTASTDHRIVRKPGFETKSRLEAPQDKHPFPLRHFSRGPVSPDDAELARDLGIALLDWYSNGEVHPNLIARAEPLFDAALKRDPQDYEAWFRKALLLGVFGRKPEGIACFDTILSKIPKEERALVMAATFSQDLRQDKALDYWRRVREANPYQFTASFNIARILLVKRDWSEGLVESRKLVDLDPVNLPARKFYIECLVRTGARAQARAELALIESVRPADWQAWQTWFAELRN